MISNGKALSVGNIFPPSKQETSQDKSTGEITLTMLGDQCTSQELQSNGTTVWKTFIIFKCGKMLVRCFYIHPAFISKSARRDIIFYATKLANSFCLS
jgi:hypothetical protein